jgi:anti-anti-sigma factor
LLGLWRQRQAEADREIISSLVTGCAGSKIKIILKGVVVGIIASEMDGVFVLIPNGRLDTNNHAEAEGLVLGHAVTGSEKVVFDFSKTDYISSAGLRVVLVAAKKVRGGGAIALCNANEQVGEVLEISGFLDIIQHYGSLQAAVDAVNG